MRLISLTQTILLAPGLYNLSLPLISECGLSSRCSTRGQRSQNRLDFCLTQKSNGAERARLGGRDNTNASMPTHTLPLPSHKHSDVTL